jgi:molecular chaperone GrpE (heat shock protein)
LKDRHDRLASEADRKHVEESSSLRGKISHLESELRAMTLKYDSVKADYRKYCKPSNYEPEDSKHADYHIGPKVVSS